MLPAVRRLSATVLLLGIIGFLAYATLVSHAQHPCLVSATNPCTKELQELNKK